MVGEEGENALITATGTHARVEAGFSAKGGEMDCEVLGQFLAEFQVWLPGATKGFPLNGCEALHSTCQRTKSGQLVPVVFADFL